MKNQNSILILLLTLCSIACTEKLSDKFNKNKDLIGRWQWKESCGGIAGMCYTPQLTDQKIIIEFTDDFLYREYYGDSLVNESSYSLNRDRSIYTGETTDMIEYDEGLIRQSFSFPVDGVLELNDECYDGFNSEYVRSK
jgi:hypothetical protein